MAVNPLALTRDESYTVPDCPVCHLVHNYQLDVQYEAEISVFFKRPPVAQAKAWTGDIRLVCQTTPTKEFARNVTIHPKVGEAIVSVTMHVIPAPANSQGAVTPATSVDQMAKDALADAFKTSGSTVRDFCKTMITIATGAIAVFFAVLKFLGGDTVGTTKVTVAILAGIASAFYLLSALLFAYGYEPQYLTHITSLEAYLKKREADLATKNLIVYTATALFSLATLLAIISFVFSFLKL